MAPLGTQGMLVQLDFLNFMELFSVDVGCGIFLAVHNSLLECIIDLGKGKFATVKKIMDKTSKLCFAMKIINKRCLQKKKLGPCKT